MHHGFYALSILHFIHFTVIDFCSCEEKKVKTLHKFKGNEKVSKLSNIL